MNILLSKDFYDLIKFREYVKKFDSMNDFESNFNLRFCFENNDFMGYYDNGDLYINLLQNKISKTKSDMASESSLRDKSALSVMMHEYCHYIEHKMSIYSVYILKFKSMRKNYFSLNFIDYPDEVSYLKEQLVEFMRIYLTNPFMLKILEPDRYWFFNDIFKPINICNKKTFLDYYNSWETEEKNHFKICSDITINKIKEM